MKISLETFSAALKAGQMPAAWGALRSLVLQPLTPLQWQRLGRILREYRVPWQQFTEGRLLKVAVIGSYTTRSITELILPHLLAEGWWAEIYEGSYGSFETEPLTASSDLYRFAPDYVLIATGVATLQDWPKPGDSESAIEARAEAELAGLRARWECIQKYSKAQIIQHSFEPPPVRSLGHLENRYAHSASRYVERLNQKLWEHEGREIRVLDVNLAAQHAGVDAWLSPRWYHHSKHGFDPAATGSYSLLLGGLWRALLGRTRKVLVCDLDNTLWGGVIGDDGLEGIALGNGSAQGEAFAAFQRYIQSLRAQGTLLAVCSKNELALAQEPFEKHPDCPLKIADFSVWECGWGIKSEGLRNIAKRLNVGLDSLVFIDDNPAECAEVNLSLPEVTVVHLESDPADFIRQLDDLYLFSPLDLTSEDLGRAQSLRVADELRTAAGQADTLEAYLAGLGMQATITAASAKDLPRVEQLFKKTNQFNWNGQTWTSAELESMQTSDSTFVLTACLKDRHAYHGLVSCAVLEVQGSVLEIKNWVMSCRVFSRTLEDCILGEMLRLARERGCSTVRAQFLRSAKNGYVAAFIERMGFPESDGQLTLSAGDLAPASNHITLTDL